MSVYPVPPAAQGAPSPHTGFVPAGAQAPPGANASVYSANSAPFGTFFGGISRQTAYSHPQQYNSGSNVPQQYQQVNSYAATDVLPQANAMGSSAASQQQRQPAAGSFQSAMHPSSSSVHCTMPGTSVIAQPQQQHQQSLANEEEALTSTQEVAHAFVYQYYLMLHENPKDVYRFYDEDSKMQRSSDLLNPGVAADGCVRAVGLQRIMQAFASMEFDKATCRIRNIEAQEVHDGGILVLVVGCLKHAENKPSREFVQTVLLAKMRHPRNVATGEGWYVHTETFLYLDELTNRLAQQNQQQQVPQQQPPQHHLQKQEKSFVGNVRQQPAAPFDEQQKIQQDQQQPKQEQQYEQLQLQQPEEYCSISRAGKEGRSPSVSCKTSGDVKSVQTASDQQDTAEHTPEAGAPGDSEKHHETELETELETLAEPTAAGGFKANEQTRNKWTKQEAVEEKESSPHWPKPGQVLEKAPEKLPEREGIRVMRQQHNYDPQSFAFKVLQNARPVAQRGFAVPASSSGPEGQWRDVEEARGQNRGPYNDQQQQQQQQQQLHNNKRLIILTELPLPINVEELKRAVAERLAGLNKGQCVEVRKPSGGRTFGVTLELDSTQSAQYIVDNGLPLNGKQVRIDYFRPRPAGTPGRGGGRGVQNPRGSWEDRRPSGDPRRGGRGAGNGSAAVVAPSAQDKAPPPLDAAEDDGEGQWTDPSAKRRQKAQRGNGTFAGGLSRGRGAGGGVRAQRGGPQE